MNMIQTSGPARIGMVDFINTAPIYEVWLRTVNNPAWKVTEAVPTTLNRMLREGELDLGFVSSHEYCLNPDKYRLLSDLSISATGAVGSVFLFTKEDVNSYENVRILLSAHSQTSISLLAIILEEFYRLTPKYENGSIKEQINNLDEFDGILAIGDEALQLSSSGRFPYNYDLGEIWYKQTGLPFVFAVWAVREEFYRKSGETVKDIHRQLLRCLTDGKKDLRTISTIVAPRIPMQPEECYKYLKRIEYDLSKAKQQGLELFYKYLIKRGEGHKDAIPLKFTA